MTSDPATKSAAASAHSAGAAVVPSWRVGHGRTLSLDAPRIMAILNVTPDSFSDGGEIDSVNNAVHRAHEAIDAGAAMLDIGGESTRPGAARVNSDAQIRRVAPVIEAIRRAGVECPISVDTTLASVARAALDVGADCINDVSGAREDASMLALAVERSSGLVLMHRLRPPGDDRYADQYADDAPEYDAGGGVVATVRTFLMARADAAMEAGVDRRAIVLDPGLGFGKTVEQNLALITGAPALLATGFPLLSAASRKSFIGRLTGVDAARDRVAGSVAVSVMQLLAGVRLFRVHDVAQHAEALRMAWAVAQEGAGREQAGGGAG